MGTSYSSSLRVSLETDSSANLLLFLTALSEWQGLPFPEVPAKDGAGILLSCLSLAGHTQ